MSASVVITIQDGKNAKSTTTINIPLATTVANATSFIGSLLPLVDALISGRILKVGLLYDIDISGLGLTGTANVLSDVEEGAVFSVITDASHLTRLRLPTFNEVTNILTGSKIVDTTVTAVSDFLDMLLTGDGTVAPCDSREEDLVSLNYARELFSKDRG